MELVWSKQDSRRWHPFGVFGGLNLDDPKFDKLTGVYCIFSATTRFIPTARPPVQPVYRTICVGKGSIRERLEAHRIERNIKRHGPHSVTWAEVPEAGQEAVAGYLADKLDPVEGERYAEVARIPVNLPYPQ